MDALQKFWYSFYGYLAISAVLVIVSLVLKLPPQKIIKIHRIPSIVWAFIVFIWVIDLPLWIGVSVAVVVSAIFWYLSPRYNEVIFTVGEATGKAFKKVDNNKNGEG